MFPDNLFYVCVIFGSAIFIFTGSYRGGSTSDALTQFASESYEMKKAYKKFILPYSASYSYSSCSVKDWLMENKGPNIAFISEIELWEDLTSVQCNDEQSMCDLMKIDLIDSKPMSTDWMYPYDSYLQPMFDKFRLLLYENGMIYRIYDKLSNKKPCDQNNVYQEMSFDFVKILFAMLTIGLILAIYIGICEKCKIWINQFKNPSNENDDNEVDIDKPTSIELKN